MQPIRNALEWEPQQAMQLLKGFLMGCSQVLLMI